MGVGVDVHVGAGVDVDVGAGVDVVGSGPVGDVPEAAPSLWTSTGL